ncbi:putative F-box protein At1g32420 [Helianthus annuus]|nr:putative F-box protein At1g32420 [Helianthus annuus]
MSDNIPIEIQVEIIKRVPAKSLIRFRSVSKQWMSLIDSPEFITYHRVNQTQQPHHLLVMHCEEDMKFKYVSIVDDDDHKFSPTVTTPTVKLVRHPTLLGCSDGLVCLFNYWKRLIVLWNPSIRKSFGIALPDGVDALGFGVCRQTSDPKIVKITHTIRYEAQVFTLTTPGAGAWGSSSISMNLPLPESMRFSSANAAVVTDDGVIHWLAFSLTPPKTYRIISFDLTWEEFGQVDLPDALARSRYLNIYKLKESVVVLDYKSCRGCDVWMMSSFTKLFTLRDVEVDSIIGFRKNGQPMHHRPVVAGEGGGELQVYDPASDSMNGLGIYGASFKMAAYTESLLLLHHSDSIIEWSLSRV